MLNKLMSNLRRNCFFFLDYLQGGIIKKSYETIKKIDSLDSNSKELKKHQNLALEKLLKHSVDTVEFYAHIKSNELSVFPVINKDTIRSQQDNFISKLYNKKELKIMHTSGSTGIPFCCYQNKEKRKKLITELIFYSEKAGYTLGNPLIQVRGNNPYTQRSKLRCWINNQKLILINNYCDQNIKRILHNIKSNSESTLLGYSTTYDSLKEYFDKNGVPIIDKGNVKGIISNGQMLFDDTRESMEETFNCKCYSRYSNEENGILGIDGIENNTFLLNEAHYILEILKIDSDEPAKLEELGRIVLTDLYNYAMPFIRYDTGDIGSFKFIEVDGVFKRAICNFSGRKLDLIRDSNGNIIYPHVIAQYFKDFSEIKQFQIIQESKYQYTLKINTNENFTDEIKLKTIFRKHLGKDTHITIKRVEEVPILSSGKRKMMINLTS